MTKIFGEWPSAQQIMVILAHPDDPEFFCGATLAHWSRCGHEIHYTLLTSGEKGGEGDITPQEILTKRQLEQKKAAALIGVNSVVFLNYKDGELLPSIELRKDIVRSIRTIKPDIIVTCDPTSIYTTHGKLNHPDHRAAGQAVLDAVYPASGNIHYFPELYTSERLEPHTPNEIWISLATQPTVVLDVTNMWEIKIQALLEHKTQIGDPDNFQKHMRAHYSAGSTEKHPLYEESFRVINLSPRPTHKG